MNEKHRFMALIGELIASVRRDRLSDLDGELAFEIDSTEPMGNGSPFALIVMDINNFKRFNQGGHDQGDLVLRLVASHVHRLCTEMGGHGYRNGGDEFVVIVPTEQQFRWMQERLAAVFSKLEFEVMGVPHHLSLSAGAVLISHEDADLKLAKSDAEIALSLAKATGRGSYAFRIFSHEDGPVRERSYRQTCTACGARISVDIPDAVRTTLPMHPACPVCSAELTQLGLLPTALPD